MSDDNNKRKLSNEGYTKLSSSSSSTSPLRFNNLSRQIKTNRKQIKSPIINDKNFIQSSPKYISLSNDTFKTAKTQFFRQNDQQQQQQQHKLIIEIDTKTQAVLDRKNYKLFEKLNKGSFGEVYKGEYKLNHKLVAIKILEISKMSIKFRERYVAREIKALIECHHKNIIEIFDIIRSNNRLFIFMEYCSNGTMTMFLKKYGKCTELLTFIWFKQLINAIDYIHNELKISHRDIKFDNILLDDKFNCKLSDFGFAKELIELDNNNNNNNDNNNNNNDDIYQLTTTICGTEPFMSPQLIQNIPYNPMKADIWALGIILFGLLNAKFPFNFNDKNIMLNEQMLKYPKFIHELSKQTIKNTMIIDLIEKILDPNEYTRLTIKEISEHKWFKNSSLIINDNNNCPLDIIMKMNKKNPKSIN